MYVYIIIVSITNATCVQSFTFHVTKSFNARRCRYQRYVFNHVTYRFHRTFVRLLKDPSEFNKTAEIFVTAQYLTKTDFSD